ncbi:putative metalloprotease CJM1_0395 family protein [Pseudomonas sp. SL4(2022)]|uniref:putative metalloprotease CJM1_0395 family protein n=1 Tax=unclassified Pseudomonas TaxID=196821 RepID=UPI002D1E3D0E|nr:putative metalloprotease CJM1_0395 family protein [Pseudomonas sp. SL4(2022)]
MSPDITRAAQAPITAAQPLADGQSASSREEADKPADSSANPDKAKSREGESNPQQQRLEQLEIAKLVSRDQEVRTHEQAHAAVGGRYAGAPSYTYERGPDGKRYAVGGEVSIDTSPIPNDPEATLRKMEVVIRAALAPAEPSAQDRQIAAQAQLQMAEARVELAQQQRGDVQAASEARAEKRKADEQDDEGEDKSKAPVQQDRPPPPSLDLYQQLSDLREPVSVIDLVA